MGNETRIDKWLWAVRLFKTRTLAAAACRHGQVTIAEQRVKPSRDVRTGDVITARAGSVNRVIEVLRVPSSRLGAKLVPEFMKDLTPPAEYEKARMPAAPPPFIWSKRSGRPTKKDRRLLEKFSPDSS